jgi:uncharacterized protein (TIGR00297 family)
VAQTKRALQSKLAWQSKLVLLLVLPFVGAHIVLEGHWWVTQDVRVAEWTVGLSALLGLITWQMRAATSWGSLAGAGITASLMFSTVTFPYLPWHTALMPVLAVSLVAFLATRAGRSRKEGMGTAESRRGREPSQIAANLGAGAILSSPFALSWFVDSNWIPLGAYDPALLLSAGLAALAQAAADTASSELGQAFGGTPRMITTLRRVEAGRDGAISVAGSAAGIVAAILVAAVGTYALRGGKPMFWISTAGAVFGLFFDSLLGATVEEAGWLNNDMVNFLGTLSAAGFSLALLVVGPLLGLSIN